jgi:hypothetical protein
MPSEHDRFDAEYYDRFYERRATRVQGKLDVARHCRGVLEVARWLGVEIESVAEVGAGTGLWRDWFAKRRPGVRYVSTELSAYACKKYGHQRLDITKKPLRGRYDLVVCQGVLPYVPARDLSRAIDHLGRMSKGLLFLECQTSRDLACAVDLELSDPELAARPASVYLDALEKHFLMLGLGLWVSRRSDLVLYQLESGTLSRSD